MKITLLMGSPRKNGSTSAMADAFVAGAESAGHEVVRFDVAKMDVKGCLGCEYCHVQGDGQCIQQDDMQEIYPHLNDCDMIVFASPIYYFTMSAQIEAAIQRVYCIGKPLKAKKAALLLTSGSPGVYDAAIAQFKGYTAYTGIADAGVITSNGEENGSEAKLYEVREFAKALQ